MPKRQVIGGVWAILILGGVWTSSRNAVAEQPPKPGKVIISEVIITNNQRMRTDQIKALLHTKVGNEYNPTVVDDDVRELYKTNQFSNITTFLQSDGFDKAKIYFSMREMPNMVRKVTFLGAKHIKPSELQDITGVKPGMPLNCNLNREGCRKVLSKYEELGRSFTDCQLIKGDDWAETEVVYQITEGRKVKVRDIQFIGNTFVSTARLSQKAPLQVGGTYTREAAEAGITKLNTYYRDFGFRDVRVALEVKRDMASDEITMIYHIQEGTRYSVKGQ